MKEKLKLLSRLKSCLSCLILKRYLFEYVAVPSSVTYRGLPFSLSQCNYSIGLVKESIELITKQLNLNENG